MSVGARSEVLLRARSGAVRARLGSVDSDAWMLGGLIVVGGLLRFLTLGHQSYWFDEAQAAHEFALPFGSMVSSMVSHESNPPLYFFLGWAWAKVFGTGAVGLRTLSALCGTALIAVIYLCGRQLVASRTGLVAAALTAVSPFMIWYSQEAREYMLLALLCGASLYYFICALDDASRRNLSGWAVFAALAVLTHSFAGFLIAPEAIALLYRRRTRATVAAVGAVAAVQAAVLPLVLGHASNSLLGFIRATPLSLRIKQAAVSFALGPLYQSSLVGYALLGAAVLVAALILLLVGRAPPRQLRRTTVVAGLAAFVLLVPLLLALAGVDYYLARALIPAWIPLIVVIASACTVPRARGAGAVLALILLGAFVYGQIKAQSETRYQRPDWRGVAAALGHAGGARAILVNDGLGTDPLRIYLPRVSWSPPTGVVSIGEVDLVASPWQARANSPPGGASLISRRVVDGYLVDRFAVEPEWRLPAASVLARGARLLSPPSSTAALLIQRVS
jgi:4-amino-4-deoxy-L-arabinose transferase-like glycosyltransferase